jgi:chorismate mutase
MGLEDTPLICAVEIDVPGALQRTIRVMMHAETEKSKAEISHIYLHGAKSLRTDIAQ